MLVLAHILLLDSVSHNSLVRTNKIASQSPTEIENNGSDRGLKMFFFFFKGTFDGFTFCYSFNASIHA